MKSFKFILSCIIIAGFSLCTEQGSTITLPLTYNQLSLEQLYAHARKLAKTLETTNAEGPILESDAAPIFDPFILGEYYLTCRLGTPSQRVDLVLDSSNKPIWVGLEICDNCPYNKRFDSSRSSTFERLGGSGYVNYRLGGYSGTLEGFTATDTFSLLSISNIHGMPLLAGTKARGNVFHDSKFPAHGAIGFNYPSFWESYGTMYELYENNLIGSREAGFYLRTNDASITLGGKDSSKYSSMTTFKRELTGYEWSIDLRKMKYGTITHSCTGANAAFLLHTPFILLPQSLFNSLLLDLNNRMPGQCHVDATTHILYCIGERLYTSDFRSLTFSFFNSYEFTDITVPASSYIEITSDRTVAIFKVMYVDTLNYVGLGTSFLSHVYLHLDAKYNEISLGWGLDTDTAIAFWIIVIIIVICVILASSGSYAGYRRYRYGRFF